MITEDNNPTDKNDPLKDAYQRLQEARDNCLKSDLNTCPLDELTALTEELKAAKEGFEEALEHDQKTNTVTAGRHTIWKREFEALDSLAKLNGIDIDKVLRGIQATENGRITKASFTHLGLTDISPLAQLTQLTRLNLTNNQIQDISPLAQLTQVKELGLAGNQIQDISPLAQLTQLTKLGLGGNQIQNTRENRETLKKLDQQAPGHGGTFQWDTLDSLAKLNGIDINEVLRGIEATENGRITKADFSSLKLTDISPLAKLTQLTKLYLQNNQIQDISPLAQLNQLTELGLEENQIQDISPLAHLTQLTWLWLGGNQIQDTRENRETLKKLEQQAVVRGVTFH